MLTSSKAKAADRHDRPPAAQQPGREHPRDARALAALPACSMLFPHTELTIAAEGTTLDELGIALIADVERWIDSILFALGLLGI